MQRIQAILLISIIHQLHQELWPGPQSFRQSLIVGVEAKGVAGIGKASGDGQSGSDKAGQQVPPEVYKALTYAGSLFLLTLSVPLILYGLNKLLNKIEDCFGCGPSSAKTKALSKQQQKQQRAQGSNKTLATNGDGVQPNVQDKQPQMRSQLSQNQKLHLQLMHQQPKCYSFAPLQEFDDGPHDNQPQQQHVHPNSLFHSSSSPIPANSFAINISSEIDSANLAMNSNNHQGGGSGGNHELARGTNPSNDLPATTKTLPFSQQQPQPFIISSPHL